MTYSFRVLLIAASLLCPELLWAGGLERRETAASELVAQTPWRGPRSPPIIFFIAKGAANSCGEGCDTWIAAHGEFDSGAAARLKRLLARIGKRDLPIYFFSPGGQTREAMAIGRIMRERKMRAGVARTIPTGCWEGEFTDSCNVLRRADREISSSLNTLSSCASACVYALLGASRREVSANAVLAVHSSKLVLMQYGEPLEVKGALVAYARRRSGVHEAETDRYTRSMGVDLELLKVARSVPHKSSRRLTREEIFKFGIDKREFGDSGWITQSQDGARFAFTRLFRKGWGGDGGFSELALRLSCSPDGTVGLDYTARGGADVVWPRDDIVVGIGSETINLQLVAGGPPGSPDIRSAVVQRPFAMAFPSATLIWVAWQNGSKQTNRTPIDLAGFANAMSEVLPKCGLEQVRPQTGGNQGALSEASKYEAPSYDELPASVKAAVPVLQPGGVFPSIPAVAPKQPTVFPPVNFSSGNPAGAASGKGNP